MKENTSRKSPGQPSPGVTHNTRWCLTPSCLQHLQSDFPDFSVPPSPQCSRIKQKISSLLNSRSGIWSLNTRTHLVPAWLSCQHGSLLHGLMFSSQATKFCHQQLIPAKPHYYLTGTSSSAEPRALFPRCAHATSIGFQAE